MTDRPDYAALEQELRTWALAVEITEGSSIPNWAKEVAFGAASARRAADALRDLRAEVEREPTEAEEPPWPGWFSCEDCQGWFINANQVTYESGRTICEGCAALTAARQRIAELEGAIRLIRAQVTPAMVGGSILTGTAQVPVAAVEAAASLLAPTEAERREELTCRVCGKRAYLRISEAKTFEPRGVIGNFCSWDCVNIAECGPLAERKGEK